MCCIPVLTGFTHARTVDITKLRLWFGVQGAVLLSANGDMEKTLGCGQEISPDFQ